MDTIEDVIAATGPVDGTLLERARRRLDSLTKPKGSLGRLEDAAARLAAMTGEVERPIVNEKTVFVFAADHGVAEEGVSAYPKEVTAQMVYNFLRGGAAINVLAAHAGAGVVVVDMGVDHDFGPEAAGLVIKKIRKGTDNIRRGPAMSRAEALASIEAGIELARGHARNGALYGTGDMGIANTTPSSAIVSALTGLAPDEVTGRGTGVDDLTYNHKVEVIKEALSVNRPDPSDPVDILAKVGGFEIGAIAGLVLGAASARIPVVIDGFISTAGALIAAALAPPVRDFLFASHRSREKGHRAMLDFLGLEPLLDLDMRLGEGTGAALAFNIIEAAVKVYNEMATFGEAGVSEEENERGLSS